MRPAWHRPDLTRNRHAPAHARQAPAVRTLHGPRPSFALHPVLAAKDQRTDLAHNRQAVCTLDQLKFSPPMHGRPTVPYPAHRAMHQLALHASARPTSVYIAPGVQLQLTTASVRPCPAQLQQHARAAPVAAPCHEKAPPDLAINSHDKERAGVGKNSWEEEKRVLAF